MIRSAYSSNDQKLEDTVFAAFTFEDFVLSSARKWWNFKNPEFIDVDEDLGKCKRAFPLLIGSFCKASIRRESLIFFCVQYHKHNCCFQFFNLRNNCVQNHKLEEMQLNKF